MCADDVVDNKSTCRLHELKTDDLLSMKKTVDIGQA